MNKTIIFGEINGFYFKMWKILSKKWITSSNFLKIAKCQKY